MLYNAKLAQDFARDLFAGGIYVIGFFPVVPKGEARISVQLSAAHEPAHIDSSIAAFRKVGKGYAVSQTSRQEIINAYGLYQ